MAVASSFALEIRIVLWHDLRRNCRAAGVPLEALPQRLPQIYEAYTVRSHWTNKHVRIQVLLHRGAYLVPYPPGRSHSVMIPWGVNAAQAWGKLSVLQDGSDDKENVVCLVLQ